MELSLLFFAGVLNVILGLFILFQNPKKPLNLVYTLFAFITGIWTLVNLLLYYSPSLTLLRLAYAVGALVMSSALAWVIYLTLPKINKAWFLTIYVFGLVFFLINFIDGLIVQDINIGITPFTAKVGPLFSLYSLFMIGALLVIYFVLLYFSRKEKGRRRAQLNLVFMGAIGFGGISLLVSFLFPLLGNTKLVMLDSPSSLILVGASAYAMIKHRFMDVRLIVARSVAYSLIIATLAAFYAAAIFAANSLIFPGMETSNAYIAYQAFLGLLMALTFQPLRRFVTKLTDKIFFKNQYDQGQLLDDLAHKIGETIILVELLYKTLDLLVSQMKVSRGIFVIISDEGTIYNMQASGYKDLPKVATADTVKMAKDGILVYDELEEGSHYKNLLRKYDAAASIPLKTENTTEGILLLGEKSSGDMFNAIDLRVFEIIAPELAIAITNAKAYERIERFNITLRQEVKKATSELEEKNEQLRELDKAKDEFISMASHQLRTPLTAIKGYLSMLLEGDAGEIKVSQYDFVNEAFAGANRMVGLINDLLNVSRMETGRFFLEPVEVDLERVATEEIKQLENHAKEKKLYLKFEKKGKIPPIWADETKIRQVVMNFIDNAIYYTTAGGVTVTLSAGKKDVIFEVTDTGIGVPKSAQNSLFTKFYRADNARHVRPDGTGLGIYLAKRVIEDHNGEIIFRSTEGKGSTFGFKFPIKSNLKVKRVSAPALEMQGTPAIGELAAGIGVPTEALEATSSKGKPEKELKESESEPATVGE